MMKKIYYLAFIPLLAVPLLSGCQKDDGLTKVTVAEVTHSIFYAPQYIAKNLGFFEEEGLKVKTIATPGADKTMAALLSGEAQIGLMGPEASVYVYNGGETNYAINFAQLTQKDGSFLLSRDPIDNFSFDMLRGKTIIGGRKGGMPEMSLEYVLKNAGLEIGRNDTTKEVNIRTDVQFDVMAGVFVAGESDFVTLFEPAASQVVRNGVGHIVASIGESSGLIPYTCYSSTKKYMEKNGETLKAFTRAIKRGLDYIYEHNLEELIPALRKDFLSSDDVEIGNVLTNYLNIEAWPTDLELKEENFNHMLDIVIMAGELPNDYSSPYSKIVTKEYI